MHPALLVAILAAALVSACASAPTLSPPPRSGFPARYVPPPPFQLEPTARRSFVGTTFLAAGTRIRFASYTLAADERLRLQRCGEGCTTATKVGSWGKAEFGQSPSQEITITEAGDYYLWLRREPGGDEVEGTAATFDRDAGVLRFASGTVVFVAVDGTGVAEHYPDDPQRIGTDAVFDPASPLWKLESDTILEKARHGVKQLLLVQIDTGPDVEALRQRTAPRPGETLDDPDAVARQRAAMAAWLAADREAKSLALASLRAAGFELSGSGAAWVSDEAQLRALQASPWVRVLNENHRVYLL